MTLTFEIGAWFFCATHCLDMLKLIENPIVQKEITGMHIHVNTETLSMTSVTLTFEIGAWLFRGTHSLDMLNTFVILS